MGKTILARQLSREGIPVYSAGQENEPWGYILESDLLFGNTSVVLSARGSIGFPKLPRCASFVSTQTTIAATFPSRDLAEFGCYWLQTVDWPSVTSGATIPMLTIAELRLMTVPLPPLAEQKRIVAKVEELLARVSAARERLARTPAILRRFRQAVLGAASEGRLTELWRSHWRGSRRTAGPSSGELGTNQVRESIDVRVPESWRMSSFGALTRNFDGSRVPVKASDREKRRGRYTYYGASGPIDTIDDYLFDGEFLLIGEDGANLLARSTPIAFRASGRFWVNNHAHVVQPVDGVRLRFLELVLNSLDLQEYVTGTAQPKMTQAALNRIPILLPPIEEQDEIVLRVEALFKAADTIEKRVAAATAQAEKLTQAILAKAFRGELVPTEAELARREGRTFETAAALLDRIPTRTAAVTQRARSLGKAP